jgi:tetratricopeptide (TPR) repeat protein
MPARPTRAALPALDVRRPLLAWCAAATLVLTAAEANARFSPGRGTSPSPAETANNGSLLLQYYTTFLGDRDAESFLSRVRARYREPDLARLIESSDATTRRAAVFSLGLLGSFKVNHAVARALRDDDAAVRDLAHSALWAIWYRADTPENNAALAKVRTLIERGRFDEAGAAATRLIERAPRFAEAYNQRAIAEFFQGRFVESLQDCALVLERNPHHFGALGGMAQCQLRLGRARDALATLRRSLALEPHDEGLRQFVAALERAEGPP